MKKLFTLSLLTISLVACTGAQSVEVTGFMVSTDHTSKIHSDLVEEYFSQVQYDYSDMSPYINGRTDQGDNLPFVFHFDYEISKEQESYLYIATIEESQTGRIFTVERNTKEISFVNYNLGASYDMTVSFKVGKETFTSSLAPFNTPFGHVRTVTVDGVNNFRDLGSYGHIKSGTIYRSATFENNTISGAASVNITEKGIKQLKELGIKTEIDLRKEEEKVVTGKSYVDGIDYRAFPLYYGGQNILTYKNSDYNNPENIKAIFELLANESVYPLDIHCVRGTDRTGCIAYLIEALMGVSEEFLERDFLYSNFYNIGSPVKLESIENKLVPSSTGRYVNCIKQSIGETLAEKTYSYLTSEKIGLSSQTLDRIIEILRA